MGGAMLSDLNDGHGHADTAGMSMFSTTDVESLEVEVRRLVGQRQRLRAVGASAVELERNRASIVRTQLQLARALIRRHLPSAAKSSLR
jgi:hypothetical protein